MSVDYEWIFFGIDDGVADSVEGAFRRARNPDLEHLAVKRAVAQWREGRAHGWALGGEMKPEEVPAFYAFSAAFTLPEHEVDAIMAALTEKRALAQGIEGDYRFLGRTTGNRVAPPAALGLAIGCENFEAALGQFGQVCLRREQVIAVRPTVRRTLEKGRKGIEDRLGEIGGVRPKHLLSQLLEAFAKAEARGMGLLALSTVMT